MPRGADPVRAEHLLHARLVAEVPGLLAIHAADGQLLAHLAEHRPHYVGLIGSRRKVLRAFASLESDGVEREWLDSIHAPIGLDIGAETPGEIAVAVAAELVSVLRGAASSRGAGL